MSRANRDRVGSRQSSGLIRSCRDCPYDPPLSYSSMTVAMSEEGVMRIPLDRESAVPLYRQIESCSRQSMLSGIPIRSASPSLVRLPIRAEHPRLTDLGVCGSIRWQYARAWRSLVEGISLAETRSRVRSSSTSSSKPRPPQGGRLLCWPAIPARRRRGAARLVRPRVVVQRPLSGGVAPLECSRRGTEEGQDAVRGSCPGEKEQGDGVTERPTVSGCPERSYDETV